jgi:hypothetical protein
MNYIVKILLISLTIVTTSKAEEILPFERLGRNNVTLDAKTIAGDSSTRNDYKTDYGSYDKTKHQAKSVEIKTRCLSSNKEDLSIRFYFVFRDAQTKKELFVPSDAVTFNEGIGTAVFRETSMSTDMNLVTIGIREKTGKTIVGWLARAIRGNRIVGIAGSTERFKKMAGELTEFEK